VDKADIILGGLLLFAGYGIAKSLTACDPFIKPGARVFLIGDSLAVGLDRFLKKFCASKGIQYASDARSGTAAFQWTRAYGLQGKLDTLKPTVVLISLGTNDTAGSLPMERHKKEIQKLISMIKSVGATPFWILPPKLPWKQTYSQLVRDEKIPVFESESINIPMGPDKIHPTGAGYAGWAGMIWQALNCGEKKSEQIGSIPPPVIMKPANIRMMTRQVNNGIFRR
jgi:hypothetical protein